MDGSKSDIQLYNESGREIPLDAQKAQNISSLLSKEESCGFTFLEIVYVDEQEIIRINKEHLERDYITDTITFRYDEEPSKQEIEGTIFCCAPRIYDQAIEHNQDSETEFKRVFIHSLLHLCGYEDDSPETKQEMTKKENFYLGRI